MSFPDVSYKGDDRMINNMNTLLEAVEFRSPSIIVVEGYNGVGKSVVVKALQDFYGVKAYRPDYSRWAGSVQREDRWAIFASFMDIATDQSLHLSRERPIIFDRGMLCGAVYNNGNIIPYYKEVIRRASVLNILVSCDRESYEKFLKVRNSSKLLYYGNCELATEKYRQVFQEANAQYIEYHNVYDEELGRIAESTCIGCAHYNVSDSLCKHPSVNKKVSPSQLRCSHSGGLEVQDIGQLQTV